MIVGAILNSIGGLYYLYETIIGKAKPNRITWILWGIFPLITFAAQRAQGVETVSLVSLASGVTPLLIVAVSFFNRQAYWKTKPLDYACLSIGVIGMALWILTDNANLAIGFAIFADAAAALPTIVKSYKHPETESWIAFALGAFGFAVSLLALQEWTFENYAFVSYLFVLNASIAVLASRKPSKDPLAIELE